LGSSIFSTPLEARGPLGDLFFRDENRILIRQGRVANTMMAVDTKIPGQNGTTPPRSRERQNQILEEVGKRMIRKKNQHVNPLSPTETSIFTPAGNDEIPWERLGNSYPFSS
jgi:hypothetical protein